MALREILAKVSACPARNRLVVLDVMRPMADPIEGILADDVASRIGQALDLAAPASQELFVLSACGAGQQSWASEELGRSIFGLAVEEGLRGLADSEGGDGDGRVTVRELARYVTRRTQAWVWHNRQARQTPVLLEKGGFARPAGRLRAGAPESHRCGRPSRGRRAGGSQLSRLAQGRVDEARRPGC